MHAAPTGGAAHRRDVRHRAPEGGPAHRTRTSGEALLDLMAGMREGAGLPTPPLDSSTGGPLRIREFLTGIGRKNP